MLPAAPDIADTDDGWGSDQHDEDMPDVPHVEDADMRPAEAAPSGDQDDGRRPAEAAPPPPPPGAGPPPAPRTRPSPGLAAFFPALRGTSSGRRALPTCRMDLLRQQQQQEQQGQLGGLPDTALRQDQDHEPQPQPAPSAGSGAAAVAAPRPQAPQTGPCSAGGDDGGGRPGTCSCASVALPTFYVGWKGGSLQWQEHAWHAGLRCVLRKEKGKAYGGLRQAL